MAGHAFLKTVQAATRTSAGTQDFTAPGVGTPKGIIILIGNGTVDGTIANSMCIGIGVCDGVTSACVAAVSEDGLADSNTARSFDTSSAIVSIPNYDGTTEIVLVRFGGWITDGVQLQFVTSDGVARLCTVIFICGSDASCKVGNFNMIDHTGTPNQTLDVTGIGFNPNLALFLGVATLSGGTGREAAANYSFGIGCLDGSSAVKTILTSYSHRDTRTTGHPSFYSSAATQGEIFTSFAGAPSGALTKVGTVNLDSFITGGFRVKDIVGGNPPIIAYMAIRMDGISMNAVVADADPANSTFSVTHTLPGSVFIMSTSADALGDKTDSQATGVGYGVALHLSGGVGLGGTGGPKSHSFFEEDGVATVNSGSISSNATPILNPTENGSAGLEYTVAFSTTAAVFTKVQNTYGTARKQLILVLGRPIHTGTGAGMFPQATGTGAGVEKFTSTGAGTFPHTTGTGAGTERFTGTGAGTFPHTTGAGVGTERFTGAGAGIFPHTTGTGLSTEKFQASGNGVFPNALGTGFGFERFQAAGSGLFPQATGTGLGFAQFAGAGDGFFAQPTGTGLGFERFAGVGAGFFPNVIGTGTGTERFTGTGAGVFPFLTGTGIGTSGITGSGSGFFSNATGTGLGFLIFVGAGVGFFPHPTGTGTGTVPAAPDLACIHQLAGSYDARADLLGSYDLVADLHGSYDARADLRGSIC